MSTHRAITHRLSDLVVKFDALSFGWGALSRKISEGGPQETVTFGYDAVDRRTSSTYPSTIALTINYSAGFRIG